MARFKDCFYAKQLWQSCMHHQRPTNPLWHHAKELFASCTTIIYIIYNIIYNIYYRCHAVILKDFGIMVIDVVYYMEV